MNESKICFISCVTNERQYTESLLYIDQLYIPESFEIEKIPIKEAHSMAQGYNIAMKQSDAKYKVYLHQDVFIINKNFIFDILTIFNQNSTIGLLGVCGAKKLPRNGIWWESNERFGSVFDSHTNTMALLQFQEIDSDFETVEALDGLILITQHDSPWREDLFDGFHFYDISQCMEYARAGYLVAIPKQTSPWIVHDCGLKKNWSEKYEHYKERFLAEYSNDFNQSPPAKKFVFYFLGLDNVHFTKDICIIPYVMKKYYGYEVELVVSHSEKEYPSNDKYTENMKMIFTSSQEEIDQVITNADVLMLCGCYDFNLPIINSFKHLNPKGKIYLKLDLNENWLMNLDKSKNNDFIETFKKCDLISVESRRLQDLINTRWGFDVKFIPNGFYDFFNSGMIDYTAKNNTILTVGRIGTRQKHSELLLNTFVKIHQEIPNWNLVMVGSIEPWFQDYYEKIITDLPKLKERITLTGPLSYEETKKQYDKAKIFCLTSRWEACANVVLESLGRGCYVIATDVDGQIDVLDYGEHGSIIPVNDDAILQKTLLRICHNELLIEKVCQEAQQYTRNELSWISLCEQIKNLLN